MLNILLTISLAVIMFNIGLELTVKDFRRVVDVPRGVAVGMVNLLFISPLLAAIVATVFNLDPVLSVGLVLLGSAPGGAMANMYTYMAKGQTALSVTLTALSSVITVVSIPFFLRLADNHFGDGELISGVNMVGISARIVAITLIPLAIGMYVKASRSGWTKAHKQQMDRITFIVFGLVVVGAVSSEWDMILDDFATVALACLTLNLAAMSLAFFSARALKLTERAATAISLELGIHNSAVAITVGSLLNDDRFMIPAGVYSLFMFINGAIFARLMYKRNLKANPGLAAKASA